MPILTPHWDILKRNGLFRAEEGAGSTLRFDVLMSLVGRANMRLRCWPSVETLIENLGVSDRTALTAVLKWLADHGAIYNVPKDKRVGKEKWLLPQKYVFQLTGIIKLGDTVMEYILMQEGERETVIDELTELGAEYAVELYGLLEPAPELDPEGADEVGRDSRPTPEVDLESRSSTSGNQIELIWNPVGKALPISSTNKAIARPATPVGTPHLQMQAVTETTNGSKPLGSTKLAEYIEATTKKTLSKTQRDILARKVKIHSADDSKAEYPSPEDMYVNQRGFSEFVVLRVEAYKRDNWENLTNMVKDIANYGRNNPGGQPGWLVWKDKRQDLTAPLPQGAAIPAHEQRMLDAQPEITGTEDSEDNLDLSGYEPLVFGAK